MQRKACIHECLFDQINCSKLWVFKGGACFNCFPFLEVKEYNIQARMSKEEKSSKKSENKKNKKRNHGKAHCNHFENGTSEQISSRKFKHKKPGKHLRVASDDFPIKFHERTRSQKPSAVNSPFKGHATPLRFGSYRTQTMP